MQKTKSLESLTRRDGRQRKSEFMEEELSPALLQTIEDTKAEIRRAFEGKKKVRVRRKLTEVT
jgi:hypothetical protein